MKPSINLDYTYGDDVTVITNTLYDTKLTVCGRMTVDEMLSSGLLTDEQISELRDAHFIVDDGFDEIEERKDAYLKVQRRDDMLVLYLVPTFRCNFKCPYCFEKDMSFEESPAYYDAVESYVLKNFKRFRKIHISLFGGEPLICYSKLEAMLGRIKKVCSDNSISFTTSATTNGYLLSESIGRSLLDLNCENIQVTLDGSKERHDRMRVISLKEPSFDRIIGNVSSFIKADIEHRANIILRMNIEGETKDDVYETLSCFDGSVRPYISLTFRNVFGTDSYHSSEEYDKSKMEVFERTAEEMGFRIKRGHMRFNPCEAGQNLNVFYVMPDLSIRKCIVDLNFEGSKLGRMDENGVITWDRRRVSEWFRNSNIIRFDKNCLSCKDFIKCAGGCIVHRMKEGKVNCRFY